jgi:hypothetical protein
MSDVYLGLTPKLRTNIRIGCNINGRFIPRGGAHTIINGNKVVGQVQCPWDDKSKPTDRTILKNGYQIQPNGTVVTKDGQRL